jgi:hypothetical protein
MIHYAKFFTTSIWVMYSGKISEKAKFQVRVIEEEIQDFQVNILLCRKCKQTVWFTPLSK